MGAPDRMLHPLVPPPGTPLGAPAAVPHVDDGEGATTADLRLWLAFIPSLRASQGTRERLANTARALIAAELVFEQLPGDRWRIGQGGIVRTYSADLPAGLAEAHAVFLAGERRGGDDAARMRFQRAVSWIEREAGARLLARRLRAIPVRRER